MNGLEEEFVAGNRATRTKLFVLLGLGLFLWLGFAPFFDLINSHNETLAKTNPLEALKNQNDLFLVMIIVFAVLFWGLALNFLRMGIKVQRSGRWPPPDMRVAFRAKVHRGRYARGMSILLFVAAGGLFLKPLLDLYAWYTVHQSILSLLSNH